MFFYHLPVVDPCAAMGMIAPRRGPEKIYLNVSEKNPATESLIFAIWYSRKRF